MNQWFADADHQSIKRVIRLEVFRCLNLAHGDPEYVAVASRHGVIFVVNLESGHDMRALQDEGRNCWVRLGVYAPLVGLEDSISRSVTIAPDQSRSRQFGESLGREIVDRGSFHYMIYRLMEQEREMNSCSAAKARLDLRVRALQFFIKIPSSEWSCAAVVLCTLNGALRRTGTG
jgi:hypothetical protein